MALLLWLSSWQAPAAARWNQPDLTPIGHVRLQGSWGERLDRAAARLHQPPLDDPGYVLADVALERKRIFTEYSGDISGRTIGVESFLSRYSTNESARLYSLIARLPAWQKPDGHFGATQALPKINRSTDMPILWGNGRLLIGLVEAFEQTGNRTALAVARKLGDYFVETDPVYCRAENLQSVGGDYADAFSTCYFSCIEGLVALARVTGEPRYRTQAIRIADLALTVRKFDHLHSHGRLTALRGMLDLHELTRDSRWLDGVERDWQTIFTQYRLPTGGVTERFSRDDPRDEGCAEADWLRLNLGLWRMTGRARYLDEAERCLNNHFLYNQFAAGGSGHRVMQILNGAPAAFRSGGTDAYWCCCEHWPRAMIDVARLAITSAPDGVRVNLFLDARASLKSAGAEWQVSTHETPNGLRVQLVPDSPVEATLLVRRPAWSDGAHVQAGAGFEVNETEDQWMIHGRWQGQQTIEFTWPRRVRLEPAPGGGIVFLVGDDLLVAPAVPANAWSFRGDPGQRPVIAWPPSSDRQVPGWPMRVMARMAGANPDDSASWQELDLAPIRQREGEFPHRCWFAFDVNRQKPPGTSAASAASARQVYVTAASSGKCQVWLNGRVIGSSSGWMQPVEGFEPADRGATNTLLILCGSPNVPRQAPGIIAGVCTPDGAVIKTADLNWRVAALTPAEADSGYADMIRHRDWQSPGRFPAARIPSRENRTSVLEDLPPQWLTGQTSEERPFLAFKLDWFD